MNPQTQADAKRRKAAPHPSPFNPLHVAKRLEGAKFSLEQVVVLLETLEESQRELATKADLAKVESDLNGKMEKMESGLRADMKEMESGLRADMKEMGSDLRADMKEMGSDLRADMKEMGSDLNGKIEKMGSDLNIKIEKMGSGLNGRMTRLESGMANSESRNDAKLAQMGADIHAVLTKQYTRTIQIILAALGIIAAIVTAAIIFVT